METIPALVRALSVISQYKCDMANLSYGEATSVPNEGRFTDLLNQVRFQFLIFNFWSFFFFFCLFFSFFFFSKSHQLYYLACTKRIDFCSCCWK